MRFSIIALCVVAAAAPAAARTHARHTAAHDSAHAIMLDDAQHLALHQLLLGHWAGDFAHDARHDTVHVRFEEDSQHQQLMVRHQSGLVGFQIRGDTLSWKQTVGGEACVIAAPVSALLEATRAGAPKSPSVSAAMACGARRTSLTLRKIVSG